MTNRGNQGQSGASDRKWDKAKDKMGLIKATSWHRWHAC